MIESCKAGDFGIFPWNGMWKWVWNRQNGCSKAHRVRLKLKMLLMLNMSVINMVLCTKNLVLDPARWVQRNWIQLTICKLNTNQI